MYTNTVRVTFVYNQSLILTHTRKHTFTASSQIQNRPLPMVTNPIYEGSPIYETVDHHLKSLNMERPQTPTTPTSIYPLIPYTVTTVEQSYSTQEPQPFPEPDNYTIMISASRPKSVSGSEGEDVRYVPEPGSSNNSSEQW